MAFIIDCRRNISATASAVGKQITSIYKHKYILIFLFMFMLVLVFVTENIYIYIEFIYLLTNINSGQFKLIIYSVALIKQRNATFPIDYILIDYGQ